MYIARIHRYNARPVDATGRGCTEEAALRNAARQLLGRRVRALYVERPVPGASTRWAYEAQPAPGGAACHWATAWSPTSIGSPADEAGNGRRPKRAQRRARPGNARVKRRELMATATQTRTRTFRLHRSRTGLPCLWEAGGGMTNTGAATIVAAPDGAPKRALYIARRGPLALAEHALIPVQVGDVVVVADHHRGDYQIAVWRLTAIGDEDASAVLVAEYGDGEWAPELPPALTPAVEAACQKAHCYHCRHPHYVAVAE